MFPVRGEQPKTGVLMSLAIYRISIYNTGKQVGPENPCVIRSFHNRGTEDVFNGFSTKAARKTCPGELARTAGDKLDRIDDAVRLEDLRIPPGNRLELLKGDRAGQHSIRINDRYRICFVWTDDGASDVQIVDYHY